MIQFRLNDKLDLMIFECTLFRVDNGEEYSINLNLALDTGCTQTIIIPQYIKAVGYDIKNGKKIGVTTGTKTDPAIELKVDMLDILGHRIKNIKTVSK